MNALPPELSPRDQRRRLFFWLGVVALPVFWSWFTLGRRFSANQRKLAFGWMASYLVLLACSHEWLIARGELLAADTQGVLLAYVWWISWGMAYWVMLHKFSLFELIALSWMAVLKWVGDTLGVGAMLPFLQMLVIMVLARIALAIWERSLARAAAAHCDPSPA